MTILGLDLVAEPNSGWHCHSMHMDGGAVPYPIIDAQLNNILLFINLPRYAHHYYLPHGRSVKRWCRVATWTCTISMRKAAQPQVLY